MKATINRASIFVMKIRVVILLWGILAGHFSAVQDSKIDTLKKVVKNTLTAIEFNL